MKYTKGIQLSSEYLKERLDYDSKSGICKWKFVQSSGPRDRRAQYAGKQAGYFKNGYIKVCIDGDDYFLHRIIWIMVYGTLPEEEIDHIDRNCLNNSLSNLRAVSNSQNQLNKKNQRNNTSGFKNVSFNKRDKKWIARVGFQGNRKHLGSFDTPEKAFEVCEKYLNSIQLSND